MSISEEIIKVEENYRSKYKEHGYSPMSLGWDKGKQQIRFDILTSQYDFTEKSVLDIGCGFGDLNETLKKYKNYSYFGIDLVEEFINEAKTLYGKKDNIVFEYGDFLNKEFSRTFDYAILSGAFNLKFSSVDNYDFVKRVMSKTYELTNDGFAFDFLSDKVDYKLEHTFHYNPSRILEDAYKYSRNVVLRNDYMPFEFCVFVFKDDSFTKDDTMFNRYKNLYCNKTKGKICK
ncbi:MAG: class I SAM-dependent methyltransferase [Chitinivibrionia bacterium]|nr:class I SAM-dependent methyltransferase [Chitinivibrionia bacterium]